MHKNQLQELAQRSSYNLPAYSCIREGPDHAPRFKATVNFNGEFFESPQFFSTLRQAEHAAAEVALNVLSKRDPSQSLAAKVLDETGICKNLLQETAQRAGVSLPVYTTIKGGARYAPFFSCTVEVGGRVFSGEPAKTKKQAEKNAAMAAWSSIKQLTQAPRITDCEGGSTTEEFGRASALALYTRDVRAQSLSRFHGGRSRVRMVNVRERNCSSREVSPVGQFLQRGGSVASSATRERSYESQRFLFNQQPSSTSGSSYESQRFLFNQQPISTSGSISRSHQRNHIEGFVASSSSTESYESQRFLFNQQPSATGSDLARSGGTTHQRSHSLTGLAFDTSTFLPHEVVGSSRGSTSRGGYLDKVSPLLRQHQPRASRLSLQSSSDRFELWRPLVEEFQLPERDGDTDWLSGLGDPTSIHMHSEQYHQQHSANNMLEREDSGLRSRRAQSERFELKPSLFDELYRRDEEEWWLRGEMLHPERERVAAYDGGDTNKYMFDGSTGSFESISYTSGYSNEPSSVGSPYDSRYRDPNSSYVGYGSNAGQRGSSAHYNVPSLYAGFKGGDKGASYGSFNVDATKASFFSNEAFEDTLSGHSNPASSSRNLYDVEGSSTPSCTLGRPHSTHWSNSPPSPSSTMVAHSLGRTASLAPPVRVRQMVAVCSAPPPRSMAVENTINMGCPSLHYCSPSTDYTPKDEDASTNDILKQLRLE